MVRETELLSTSGLAGPYVRYFNISYQNQTSSGKVSGLTVLNNRAEKQASVGKEEVT